MTQSPAPPPFPREVSVEEVAALIRSDAPFRLIDVREPWEREIVSLPRAEPLNDALVDELLKSGPRAEPLIFMCHHGIRSLSAAAFFASHGFSAVSSMSGGIAAWAQRIDPSLARY